MPFESRHDLSLPAAAGLRDEAAARALREEVDAHLAAVAQARRALALAGSPRTLTNTLEPLHEAAMHLDAARGKSLLLEATHPDPPAREAAEACRRRVQETADVLALDREAYDALAGLPPGDLDPPARRYRERLLRDYRLAGVHRDAQTRERILRLRQELLAIGQAFTRNIRESRRHLHLDGAEPLAGLPDDYVRAHPPDAEGKVRVTTEYPDYFPFMTYAHDREARRRLYLEFTNRAFPENVPVLHALTAKRHELANALGHRHWADHITADKMAGSGEEVAAFLDRLVAAAGRRADADYADLLARKREDEPQAGVVEEWERQYYAQKVRAARHELDSQAVRWYFPLDGVKRGALAIFERVFGVALARREDLDLWHPDVELYEVRENTAAVPAISVQGRLLGRLYLDLHPRPGKFTHAAQFTLARGVAGRRVPEAVLVCNFNRPGPDGMALLEFDDVQTFFHELGHFAHTIFGGNQPWVDLSGIATEGDFIEVPSLLFEEWVLDPKVLRNFARHATTGEPIPSDLAERLIAAREFGRGLYVRQQTFYAAISLHCYCGDPGERPLDLLVPQLQRRYSPYPYVEGSHMAASFNHLEGYSATYYTYMWSLVIEKDLFGRFRGTDLLDPAIAREFRRTVLEPGGSRDAADLVRTFLGRPHGFEVFERWLGDGDGGTTQ